MLEVPQLERQGRGAALTAAPSSSLHPASPPAASGPGPGVGLLPGGWRRIGLRHAAGSAPQCPEASTQGCSVSVQPWPQPVPALLKSRLRARSEGPLGSVTPACPHVWLVPCKLLLLGNRMGLAAGDTWPSFPDTWLLSGAKTTTRPSGASPVACDQEPRPVDLAFGMAARARALRARGRG